MTDRLEDLKRAIADRYRIERELGSGGMATVYLARDVRHDRDVAVKVLRADLAASLGAERFLREIQIAANLTHPNILPLHDSGEADGTLYYVMPYIDGESLRDRLSREVQLPIDEALQIFREVADALGYAHRQGIVHRDIKPENILFAAGHAVVADFGIARAVTEAGGDSLTQTGLTVGTPAYMSPEQATGAQELDSRTDLYSLACVLYEMLTGETPYTGPTPLAVVAKKLSEPLPRVSVVREAVPVSVEAALTKALSRTPADRYRTAEEFITAIEVETPARAGLRSVRLPVVAVVAVVILAIAGYFVWQGTRPLTLTASNPRQVTFDPGPEEYPRISPDGEEVAFIAGESPRHLYVQSLSGGTAQEVAEAGGTHGWSRDGQRVFFGGGSGGTTSALQEVAKLGGPARVLARPDKYNASLLPSGDRYVGWRDAAPPADTVVEIIIATLAEASQTEQVFAVMPLGSKLASFSWSPNGQRLAFKRNYTAIEDELTPSSIWVARAGEAPVQVTDDDYRDLSPVWLPDNRHLLFISDRDGPRDVYVVDSEDPREPQRVTFGEYPASISVSADGRRMAYAKHRFRRNIWAVPFPADDFVSIRDGRPITSVGWNQLVMEHDLSPSGDSLVFDFRADPGGEYQIYKMAVEGGAPIQLSADSPGDYGPVFSPDGREVAFLRDREEGIYSVADLWVMDADGANARREATDLGGWQYYDWSPDGLQIVYERGSDGLWAVARDSTRQGFDMPVEFSDPAQWSEVDCQLPRWAPDGSSLVCNGPREEGGRFWSLLWLSPGGEVNSRQDPPDVSELMRERDRGFRGEERAPPGLWWMRFPRFSPDGSTIYFFAMDNEPGVGGFRRGVWSIPSTGGDPSLVTYFDDPSLAVWEPKEDIQGFWLGSLTVGADEIYLSVGESEVDVWVLDLDW
jgi:Tol biopolymer transport system component